MRHFDLRNLNIAELPLALADAHWSLKAGDLARIRLPETLPEQFSADLLDGAGFESDGERATRLLTLPDTVGDGMRLLVCGLNPSIYAAEMGVGFGRPGNRFWPAALDAGIVGVDRDPRAALVDARVGMTDLVKRATRRAADLDAHEYRCGLERVDRLVARHAPGIVCFVGLAGWRAAVDRKAVAGPQPREIGGRPVYLMPSTSGLNAHASRAELADHLAAAAKLAD